MLVRERESRGGGSIRDVRGPRLRAEFAVWAVILFLNCCIDY